MGADAISTADVVASSSVELEKSNGAAEYHGERGKISKYELKRLKEIHATLHYVEGVSPEAELPEQIAIMRHVNPDSVVLELGANVGRATLLIQKMIHQEEDSEKSHSENSSNIIRHLAVETVADYCKILACHRDKNFPNHIDSKGEDRRCFEILPGAISEKRLFQKGWKTYVEDEDTCGEKLSKTDVKTDLETHQHEVKETKYITPKQLYDTRGAFEIPTFSWGKDIRKEGNVEIEKKGLYPPSKFPFNTIIADCEGALVQMMKDNPATESTNPYSLIADTVEMIMVEHDFWSEDDLRFFIRTVTDLRFEMVDYIKKGTAYCVGVNWPEGVRGDGLFLSVWKRDIMLEVEKKMIEIAKAAMSTRSFNQKVKLNRDYIAEYLEKWKSE